MTTPSSSVIRQFLSFTVIGTVAFLLDAGVLILMIRFGGLGPYIGRVVSFLCAATFTWFLNRSFTFRSSARQRRGSEWIQYLGANVLGAAVNFGVYAALVATLAIAARHPVLGVAAGSLAGLIFNFTLSRRFVFRASA